MYRKGYANMAQKSNDRFHLNKSMVLRELRLEGGFTQQELAHSLGMSREKVVAVENCHQNTMVSLEQDTIRNWWQLCRPMAKDETQKRFSSLIKEAFLLD